MDIIPETGWIHSEDGALNDSEQGIGAESPTNSNFTTSECEIASILSDLENLLLRLDQLGLALAAARVSHAIDLLKKS